MDNNTRSGLIDYISLALASEKLTDEQLFKIWETVNDMDLFPEKVLKSAVIYEDGTVVETKRENQDN